MKRNYSISHYILLILSFILVAFGQPVWSWWLGLIAACVGYAIFWRLLLKVPQKSHRFIMAMGWYGGIQVVQLSWMASHPYLYIYGVILFCAWMTGAQFGLLALFIQPSLFTHVTRLLAVAAIWPLLEWSRLFVLSGLSFNPSGLSLTGSLYALQFATLGGVYLLSFWVMLTNMFMLRAWINRTWKGWVLAMCLAVIPYGFGYAHWYYHLSQFHSQSNTLAAVLIQPAFSVEEHRVFASAEERRLSVLDKWEQIISLASKHQKQPVDVMVLPEYVVPYGTYHPMFFLDEAVAVFKHAFGGHVTNDMPPMKEPYALYLETYEGPQWLVTNAFFGQFLANIFHSDVIIGLEDSQYKDGKRAQAYSSAIHFTPKNGTINQYEKRVLVPMGEYIPFEWCRELAAKYGISGSFTCGTEAKVFQGKVPFSPTICYEETYGGMVREGRLQGAQLFVNLTNDGWFPESILPKQHFDHARLRTVESGVPLIRACNTGVTSAIDSLGRVVNVLGDQSIQSQTQAGSLYVQVPLYHYQTLYARFGDGLVLIGCLCLCLLSLVNRYWWFNYR